MFVNRQDELRALERWWDARESSMALVWGRRRVGKTALIQRFARSRRTVFHTAAGRPVADELSLLSRTLSEVVDTGVRDLGRRPLTDWDDAFETLAAAAARDPLLLVLDEFPELVRLAPALPGILRAFWDHAGARTKLRIVVCGSAVRTMHALQEEREPLYGRFDLSLPVQPFRPHEASRMLGHLQPADRALVWGIVGGVPPYLTWWDQNATVRQNLLRLACSAEGRLFTEGQLVLASEGDLGDLGRLVLRAIAAGRTRHTEIEQAVGTEPGRVLERLVELRLVERLEPVTESGRRTRRRTYRIADNFLAFWLGALDRHRSAIERGLGRSVVTVLTRELDDHMGPRFEGAFRQHLVRLAAAGELGGEIVDIGPFWRDSPPVEIDAVALAGRPREAVLAGEAKWSRSVDARRILRSLERKAEALPRRRDELRYAVCTRERVTHAWSALALTAADIFPA